MAECETYPSRPDGNDATYVEPLLTLSFATGIGDTPIRVGVPLAIGLSDTYYAGRNGGHPIYGFFRTGVTASATLAKRADRTWRLARGVTLWVPNGRVASGLDGVEAVFRIGTSVSF